MISGQEVLLTYAIAYEASTQNLIRGRLRVPLYLTTFATPLFMLSVGSEASVNAKHGGKTCGLGTMVPHKDSTLIAAHRETTSQAVSWMYS